MTDLVERLRALQATLAQMTDSEFAVACSGEFCEDFKNTIEGCIANGLDRITALEAEIARKDAALALCAKHVDWMPHPHSVAVEAAIRAALEATNEPA